MSDPVNITLSGPAPEGLVTEEEFAKHLSVTESPFTVVDNESQFDKALSSGRSMLLRGENSGGVVKLTTPKIIRHHFLSIKGPSNLQFTLGPGYDANPRALSVFANNVTLQDFELTNTVPVADNINYGIALAEGPEDWGHRLTLSKLHIHGWMRCISKDGSSQSRTLEDTLIKDCYCHTSREATALLNFGLLRLKVRDSRFLGRVQGDTHINTHNAFYGGANWWDCVFENCLFGNVDRIGFESMCPGYQYVQHRTRLTCCRSENTGSMGFSTMFGEGIVLEKCVAKNVKWIGFEIGGRPPEYTPPDYRYGQGIIDSCEVDGVTSKGLAIDEGSGQGIGISIDGAKDTIVRGSTRISNITSPLLEYGAAGIVMASSERCSIKDVTLVDAGHLFIVVTKGDSPNTRGFHEVCGNTFRNSPNDTAHRAIHVEDTSAAVRNNISFQKVGTDLSYTSLNNAPAVVNIDGTEVPYGLQQFRGSNIIVPSGNE